MIQDAEDEVASLAREAAKADSMARAAKAAELGQAQQLELQRLKVRRAAVGGVALPRGSSSCSALLLRWRQQRRTLASWLQRCGPSGLGLSRASRDPYVRPPSRSPLQAENETLQSLLVQLAADREAAESKLAEVKQQYRQVPAEREALSAALDAGGMPAALSEMAAKTTPPPPEAAKPPPPEVAKPQPAKLVQLAEAALRAGQKVGSSGMAGAGGGRAGWCHPLPAEARVPTGQGCPLALHLPPSSVTPPTPTSDPRRSRSPPPPPPPPPLACSPSCPDVLAARGRVAVRHHGGSVLRPLQGPPAQHRRGWDQGGRVQGRGGLGGGDGGWQECTRAVVQQW